MSQINQHLAPSIIQELERLNIKYQGETDRTTCPISRVYDVNQLLNKHQLPSLYLDFWDECEPRELDDLLYMNDPAYWSGISFVYLFYDSHSQFHFVARDDDPVPSNPFVFHIDHDGSDRDQLGTAEQFPDEEASIGRLSDFFGSLDRQARSELNGVYYGDFVYDERGIEACFAELNRIGQLEMTTCDQMSYWLFLTALHLQNEDIPSAKETYAKFLAMPRYPLRTPEKDILQQITSILDTA